MKLAPERQCGNSLGKTEAVSNPWQFAGGFYDATTGLYKFGTRYYSPTLGRWTQQDPVGGSVGKVGSGNAYVYADNVPVMLTDPSGKLTCFQSFVIAAIAVYGAVDFGSAVAGAVFLAVAGGPLGFILGLAVVGIAIYSLLIAINQALDDCGLSQYKFSLPF